MHSKWYVQAPMWAVSRFLKLSTPLLCAVLIGGCTNTPPREESCLQLATRKGKAVARIGDYSMVIDEVADRVRKQGATAVHRYVAKGKMRGFIEDQIRFELLVLAAKERGLHRDPEVVDAARKVMVRKLLRTDMADHLFAAQIIDKDIEAYYNKRQNEYVQPEKRRYADIQLAPTAEGRVLAEELIRKLQARTSGQAIHFKMFRQKHSLRKRTRRLGVDELFKARTEVDEEFGPNFSEEIFSIPSSAEGGVLIDHPVQSTKGWHVVELLSVREALTRSLGDARSEIIDLLRRDTRTRAFERYLADLKRRYPVQLYEDRIEDVVDALRAQPNLPIITSKTPKSTP